MKTTIALIAIAASALLSSCGMNGGMQSHMNKADKPGESATENGNPSKL